MSEAELLAAEDTLHDRLAAYAASSSPGEPVFTFAALRVLIRDRNVPGWLQRVRANMDPVDLLL